MTSYEKDLNNKNIHIIAGIDEAGRGPIAGPVVAAAVIINLDNDLSYINDSKKLTEKKRLEAFTKITNNFKYGIGIVDIDLIDNINILEATKLAMKIAVLNLEEKPEHLLIDALNIDLDIKQTNIIKGDLKSASIAAASIVAKVTRDNIMKEYDLKYPLYNFGKHKGYLTKEHKENIIKYGPSPIHRKSFEPIKSIILKSR